MSFSHSSSGIELLPNQSSYDHLASFDSISHLSGSRCSARINIIDGAGRFSGLKDKKMNFNSKLFLFKISSQNNMLSGILNSSALLIFEIHLCPGNNSKVERIGLEEITDFHPDKKHRIIKFVLQKSEFSVEFLHLHDFVLFRKYLQMSEAIIKEENEKKSKNQEKSSNRNSSNTEFPVTRKKTNDFPTKGKFSVKKVFHMKKRKFDFCEIPCTQWQILQVKKWLESTYYQETDSDNIITIFEKLKKSTLYSGIEWFLKDHSFLELKDHFQTGKGFPKIQTPQNQSNSDKKLKKKKNIIKGIFDISGSSDINSIAALTDHPETLENPKNPNNISNTKIEEEFAPISNTRKIETKFLDILEELDLFGGYFPYPYYLLVKKILKNREKHDMTLREIEGKLKYKKPELWHVDECRDCILIMLLFSRSLKEFVKEQENEFHNFMKAVVVRKQFEQKSKELEKLENNNNNNNNNNKEEEIEGEGEGEKKILKSNSLLINKDLNISFRYEWEAIQMDELDPFVFEDILIKFNRKKSYRLEHLSFKFFKHTKILEKQKQIFGLQKEIDKRTNQQNQIKQALDQIDLIINETSEKLSSITERILEVLEQEEDSNNPNILQLLEKQTNRLDESQKLSETQKIEKKKELENINRKIENSNNETKLIREKIKILKNDPENIRKQKLAFIYSKERRMTLERIIKSKIMEFTEFKKEKTFELVVKLILSKLSIHSPTGFQKTAMKFIDPIFKPKFFQWGFLHSSLSIKNVQMHWFSHALVEIKEISLNDNYEDICCIDCDCPIICNYDKLNQRIRNLAKLIVKWNLEINYAPYSVNFGSNSKKKNCQEFVFDMLKSLEYVPFYPEIEKYLQDLKQIVKRKKKKVELRFIKLDSKFESKFQDAINFSKVRVENRKGMGKYICFHDHKEVDEFTIECQKIDRNFKVDYSGFYQLLKGFDRAFHLLQRKSDVFDDICVPSDKGCPFVLLK